MKNETIMLPLSRLQPSRTQPRKHFDQGRHEELTLSMKQHGFTLSTLLVRPIEGNGEGYEIVVGERRVRAAKAAGIDRAPCYVREYSDSEVIAVQLVENLQREDLTPIEQAEGYQQALSLIENGRPVFTIESLAERTGHSPRTIRDRLSLLKLPPEARREVETGRLPATTAMLIARIPDETVRLDAARVILHPKDEIGPLSHRRAELAVHQHFIRDLRQAHFDQADAELLPIYLEDDERAGGGACADCPFKAGNVLAGEIEKQVHNTCMNPACFEKKEALMWSKWQAANTNAEKNRYATTEDQSLKLYPRGDQLAQHFGLVDIAECPDGSELKPGVTTRLTWRRLVKDANVKVIVTRDRLGATHELIDREQAIEAARQNGQAIFKTATRERVEVEQRKAQEQTKHKSGEVNKAVVIACIEEVKKKVTLKTLAAMLRLQLDRELEFSPAHADWCKRNGLPVGSAIANQVSRWNLKDLVGLLVEFVIAEGGFSYDAMHEKNRAWLEIFGVNYDKVAKRLSKKAK